MRMSPTGKQIHHHAPAVVFRNKLPNILCRIQKQGMGVLHYSEDGTMQNLEVEVTKYPD